MTVNDTDKFLVNRSGSSYNLEAQNLMAELQDDDLMLVNRAGKSYKATGAEIKGSLKPPAEVLKPQILAPADGAGTTYTPTSTEIVAVGSFEVVPPATAAESRQFSVGTISSLGKDVTNGSWDFANANARPSGPLVLGNDWGTTGDFFMLRFDNPTLVVGGRNATYSSPVPMSLVGCDDGINWVLQDHKPGNPVFSDPNTCLRGKQPFKYWGIIRASSSNPNEIIADMDGVYSFGALSTTTTELEVATAEGLSGFIAGSDVQQNDGAASGDFGSYSGTKVYITNSTGTWTPNAGKYIVGPEVTDPNAVDPSGVNFVGSTFASSDGSLTAGSADWQVTTLADTGYSSPVSQVTGHTEMGPPPTWTSGELEAETEYRARTKYKAASGEESEWSDDVTFKTESKNVYVSFPGDVWASKDRVARFLTSPAKIVMLSITNDYYAVGVDNKLYVGLGDTATSLADTGITFPSTPVTGYAKYGTKAPAAFAMSNGDLHVITGTTGSWTDNKSSLGGTPVQLAVDFETYKVWVLMKNGDIKHTDGNAFTNASAFTSWMTGTDYKHFAVCKKKWDGSTGATFFGVKSDGTVDAVDQTTKAVTPVPGATGIARVVTTNSGVVTLVKADGSELLFGGNLASHFNPPITSVTPPAGDKWVSVGGGYQSIYATTAAGKAYEAIVYGLLATSKQLFPTRSPNASETVSHMPPFTMINLPRPVETVSMQEVSPGGNQGALIIP